MSKFEDFKWIIREETLEETRCDDYKKEKEYCCFFDHLLQHDEHGPEKSKEVKIQ
jgi:hypothetical protein